MSTSCLEELRAKLFMDFEARKAYNEMAPEREIARAIIKVRVSVV